MILMFHPTPGVCFEMKRKCEKGCGRENTLGVCEEGKMIKTKKSMKKLKKEKKNARIR
jgi:hypothetical protein